MTELRMWMTVVAGLALLASAFPATAQPTTCNVNAGVPPVVRAEGLTELTGDIVVTCTGMIPNGGRYANIQLFLNTSITNRILNTATGETDALLLLDDPAPGTLKVCPYLAGCTSGTANAFQGVFIPGRSNALVFAGIPIDGTGTIRTIRLTNVRANAANLGAGGTSIPTQVVAFVSVFPPFILPLNNPQQTVGYVQPGLAFNVAKAGPRQVITFIEGFSTAFKSRVAVGAEGNPVPQDVPGQALPTESGFYPDGNIGLADFGTRLKAVFSNIRSDVTLSVPLQLTDARTGTVATLIASEAGPFSPRTSGDFTATNGIATAVWEITRLGEGSIGATERLSAEVTVRFTNHPGSPALGTATVGGSFAPTSTESFASATATIPRFAATPIVKNFRD